MDHIPFNETPVEKLNYFSKKWGINLFVKRDDLFSNYGGGSKVRMLHYILHKVKRDGYNVLITAGGPCSNFNRAASLMAARMNLKFVLVLYSESPILNEGSLNLYLTRLSGADIRECDKTNVPDTIDNVINEFIEKGYKPYYIWGGGMSLEGSYAYYDAVLNLKNQIDFKLDHIICPCGTGTTLSGIHAGAGKLSYRTSVVGISVARKVENEIPVVQNLIHELELFLKQKQTSENNVNLIDDYILDGYGTSDSDQLQLIKSAAENEGILLDPVYSGKAFYGLSMLIKKGYIGKDSNVLFWHTGSIFNLLSYDKIT